MIDSGQVPRGKGEKQPGEGDEIVSETMCLQGVKVRIPARVSDDGVPIEEWANEFIGCGFLKGLWSEGAVKASVNSAFVALIRPETGWANHDQGELCRNAKEGPNQPAVQHWWMSCG